MKQLHSFDELRQIKDTKVYALGTFDGIHRGHQRVIRKAVEEAASVNGVSIIITFEHHPLTILHPERVPKRVIQEEVMDTVLDDLNVDYILRLPMNEELLQMSADEFLDALCTDMNVQAIVIGENFTFGAKGLGNPTYMKQALADKHIQVLVQPLLPCDGLSTPISSTEIRKAIREGRLEEAHYAAQSGAHWFVGYCRAGNTWDFQQKLIVADDADVEITIEADSVSENPRHVMSYGKLKRHKLVSRVHMYVTVDKDNNMHVIKVKPY